MKRRRLILFITAATVVVGLFLFKHLYPTSRLRLPAGTTTPQISLGFAHGVVIAPDGTLWSWGAESVVNWPVLGFGQTNGIPAVSPVLRRISSATNWVKVSAGFDHTLALKSDGSMWAWGANHRGQLGTGAVSPAPQSSPSASVPGNDWVDVEAASGCSYALKNNGSLWAWGSGIAGQVRIGSSINSPVAIQVGSATNWTKVRAGGVSAAGLQRDGSLWIWGGNPQFGNSDAVSPYNLALPARVGTDTNWVDVSVGFNIWLAVKSDGTLWAFGNIPHDRNGTPESAKAAATQIGTNSDWVSIKTSQYGHLLRKRDGSFWMVDGSGLTSRVLISNGSPEFQKIEFPKDSMACDTGEGTAAVVTGTGEVWAQGWGMGEETRKQWLMYWFERRGLKNPGINFDPAERVVRENPWPVRNIDPGDRPK